MLILPGSNLPLLSSYEDSITTTHDLFNKEYIENSMPFVEFDFKNDSFG